MTHKKNVLLGSIIGAGVGYGVVHPLVMFITSYETRDYVGGIRIVDIEKASRRRLSEPTRKHRSKAFTHLRPDCSP